MKKEIPMLFSTPMVIAADDESKTMTRRIKGLENINPRATEIVRSNAWPKQGNWVARLKHEGEVERYEVTDIVKCSYGEVGDVIWVRETWAETTNINSEQNWPDRPHINTDETEDPPVSAIIYLAHGHWPWLDENGSSTEKSYWKPSIHMKKIHARIWLEIVDIKVERLNDISEEDAKQEGIKCGNCYADGFLHYDTKTFGAHPIISFKTLWESINGDDSWEANPWVWVIKFKKLG